MSGTTLGLATANDLSAFKSWQIELFPSLTVTVLGLAWQTVHLSNIYPPFWKKKKKTTEKKRKEEGRGGLCWGERREIDQEKEGEYKLQKTNHSMKYET